MVKSKHYNIKIIINVIYLSLLSKLIQMQFKNIYQLEFECHQFH